jgi:cytochrome c553
MVRERGPFKLANPWPRIAWWFTAGMLATSIVVGFVVLGREQQNQSPLGAWTAICRALGITADTGPSGEPRPPLRTPSRIAWTSATLTQIAGGDAGHGAFIARYCTACHGQGGVSNAGLYPTLAGIEVPVIYKQLDDFRARKRSWGAMNAIAQALSAQDAADVGVYFASRTNGLKPIRGERLHSGHTLREHNPALRLVFAGDPARHSALRRLPWSRRQRHRRTVFAGAAARLYRAPARGVRPGVSSERHQRADAHHRSAIDPQ